MINDFGGNETVTVLVVMDFMRNSNIENSCQPQVENLYRKFALNSMKGGNMCVWLS